MAGWVPRLEEGEGWRLRNLGLLRPRAGYRLPGPFCCTEGSVPNPRGRWMEGSL